MVSTEKDHLHMLFFPLMAHGHMLPMVDMAKVFAYRGVQVTILTTPANAAIIRPSLDRFNSSNNSPPILHLIPFPSTTAGLPEGSENCSFLPSENLVPKFIDAISMLRQPFDDVLAELRPDCIVTEFFMPWTYDLAAKRGIPRLGFNGAGFFPHCASLVFQNSKPFEGLAPDAESVVLPGLPDRIEMLKKHFLDLSNAMELGPWISLVAHAMEVEPKSFGLVMNSFYELEPHYVEHLRGVQGRKAWHVGPVALCNKEKVEMSERGGETALLCLDWLDEMKPGSVLYVCFGSMSNFTWNQMREMALGFEASGHPFLWVVRNAGDDLIPEGFEERFEGRGLVIRGWAPQLLILNHAAVGGFLTHCGWNSCLEGICAGLPMVTWPLFADQFYNERFIVDVLEIGVAVGAKDFKLTAAERTVVEAASVEAAVRRMMGGDEEAEERRRRVRELKKMAYMAGEEGGSSYTDVGNLIQTLKERKAAAAEN